MDLNVDIEEIKTHTNYLPAPFQVFEKGGVKCEVFIAKNLHTDKWEDSHLHSLVLLCRRSFLRYGKVLSEDGFDKKALVLLARTKYMMGGHITEEWLSIRFIPATGEPYLSEDLKLKLSSGKTFFEVIKEKLFSNSDQASDFLLTISRICGILPYNISEGKFIAKKLQYTALTSAWTFLVMTNILQTENKYQYVTALFHQNIFRYIKQRENNDNTAILDLPNAHEVLKLPGSYFDNIEVGDTAYFFPTYFYNLQNLVDWLKKIIDDGLVQEGVINKFLLKPIDWKVVESQLKNDKVSLVRSLSGLGNFLAFDGRIDGVGCSGDELRKKLELEVAKSFSLKLFSRQDLKNKIQLFLEELI